MELVDHVFSKFYHEGLIKQDILNMMEEFGLVVKFATPSTDVLYLVPSQLKSPPRRLCKMEPSPSDPCPLYLHFLEGFVPHGFFSQLVSRCTRWCFERAFKGSPNLFDGAARFFIEKERTHQLVLVCKKRFIKVVLKQSKPDNKMSFAEAEADEVASMVRGFLEDTLQNLSRELSWLRNLKYDWRVACPYCLEGREPCPNHDHASCTHEDCLCLIEMLEGGKLNNCPNNFGDEQPTLPTLKKWFAIKGEAFV